MGLRSWRELRRRDDIVTVAGRLRLAAFYVPSMRNGEPRVTTERGNAILSTLPCRS
jgi:hypothetical protein